jgi:glycine cleavage system aminomethyltransferase T
MQPERLYHLALEQVHRDAGAVFHDRAGWRVPAHFGDPAGEFAAIRADAAIAERSHYSRILVLGTDAAVVLGAVFAGHVDELEEGRTMRAAALDSDGTIGDLALVLRTGGISYLVIGEPSRRDWTLSRLRSAVASDFDARVEDRTESTCLIGLTGPGADGTARAHLAESLPARVLTLHAVTFEFHGFRTLAVRTSDTGEDGYLFRVAPAVAQHMIETLRGAGVPMAGDIALDWARVEACIPAFTPDLEDGLDPAEADLDMLLGLVELGGATAPNRILSALLIEGDAASGDTVRLGARIVGKVRSAARLPERDTTCALAVMEAATALPGTEFDVAGNRASIVAKPFFRRRS